MEKEVLSRLYETVRERDTTTEYDNLMEEYCSKKEKFLKDVGEEHQEEFEQIMTILHKMEDILAKEDFCEGVSIAVKLFTETIREK